MTSLLPPASQPGEVPEPEAAAHPVGPRPRPAPIGALFAVGWTAPPAVLLCAAITVSAWLVDGEAAGGDAPAAARLGANLWLLAHHAPLELAGSTFELTPLGLSLALALLCFSAGGWLARTSTLDRPLDLALGIGTYAACYAGFAALAALMSGSGLAHVSPWHALLPAGALATVCGGAGMLVEHGELRAAVRLVPPQLRTTVRAAAYGTGSLLGAATLLLMVALAGNAGQFAELGNALNPGIGGWVALVLLCLLYLPNAVVFTVAYALGPGFALGTGTVVAPTAVQLGPMPSFPLLAAAPAQGPPPAWAVGVLALPVAAAALAGALVSRRHPELDPGSAALLGGLAGGGMALAVSLLSAVGGGAIGPGRMVDVGSTTATVALVAILLCSGCAAVAAVVRPGWRWWRSRRAGNGPASEGG